MVAEFIAYFLSLHNHILGSTLYCREGGKWLAYFFSSTMMQFTRFLPKQCKVLSIAGSSNKNHSPNVKLFRAVHHKKGNS